MPGKVDNKMKNTLFTVMALFVILTLVSCRKTQEIQNPSNDDFLTKTETAMSEETEPIPTVIPQEIEISPSPKETSAVTSLPTPKATAMPTPTPAVSTTPKETNSVTPSSSTNPLRYGTKTAFHNAIIEAKTISETNAFSKAAKTLEQGNSTSGGIEEIENYFDFANLINYVELFEIRVLPLYITLDYRDENKQREESLIIRYDRRTYSDNYIEQARTRLTTNPIEINYNGHIIIKSKVYQESTHISNNYFWVEHGHNLYISVPAWLLELYPEETFFDVRVVNVPSQ
jgi:hypothetical protein